MHPLSPGQLVISFFSWLSESSSHVPLYIYNWCSNYSLKFVICNVVRDRARALPTLLIFHLLCLGLQENANRIQYSQVFITCKLRASNKQHYFLYFLSRSLNPGSTTLLQTTNIFRCFVRLLCPVSGSIIAEYMKSPILLILKYEDVRLKSWDLFWSPNLLHINTVMQGVFRNASSYTSICVHVTVNRAFARNLYRVLMSTC